MPSSLPAPVLALQHYLHEHIPLSQAMQLEVQSIEDGIVLSAPLAPNINHRHSAFGGSISSLAVLAGWSWIHVFLGQKNLPSQIVIQSSHIDYLLPVTGSFSARCPSPEKRAEDRFCKTLEKFGKARITLSVEVLQDGAVAAAFEGAYVAVRAK